MMWEFGAVFVTQAVVLVGVIRLRSGQVQTSAEVSQINRAVNHQPKDSPTLVERVGHIEAEICTLRTWERDSFRAIARQVGCKLPPYPKETTNG